MLDSTPKTSTHIIVNEDTGRPYAESTFQRAFAEIRRQAGLPDELKFADFRRTAATEMAGASATDDELRSITGHLDRDVVARYALPNAEAAAKGCCETAARENKTGQKGSSPDRESWKAGVEKLEGLKKSRSFSDSWGVAKW